MELGYIPKQGAENADFIGNDERFDENMRSAEAGNFLLRQNALEGRVCVTIKVASMRLRGEKNANGANFIIQT